MIIIGVDFHPEFQQVVSVDIDTGELQEKRLEHPEAAEKFYRDLAGQGMKVRVGMEASGHARWFERLLAELNFELWQQNVELLNGQPAPLHGGVRSSNHDRACDRRDAWVGSRC